MRLPLASIFALALVVWPHVAVGTPQNPENPENPYSAPAHVSYVEGTATLERDGRPENAPLNMPLLSGDRLKTLDGRLEVLFADGSALHMDSRSTIDLQSDDLIRLIDGRLRVNIASLGDSAQARSTRIVYRVDSPAGSVRITQAGEYRIAMLRRGEEMQLELAVLRGAGEIFTDEGTTTVRAGERAYASAGLAPSYAYTYNSASWDAFDRWSEARRDTRLGVSTQYLPSEVRAYASTFDEDGDWRYNQSYGYVWYPRVAVSWRPYYYGRWSRYPRFGWTWIGADRFAWPTHHYGRWGFSSGAWFWIPASRWAPAYVSWAYAPGYVSWCPLGFDNRPVIGINIFNVGPGYYSSWRAWTAVGYSHFGRDYVHRRAVDWDRFDRTRRPSFQLAQSAPASRDVAVPRSSARGQGAPSNVEGRSTPIRWAGARERDTAPRYINRGDEIVRSRTERPSASPQQRPTDFNTAIPRASTGTQGIPSGVERRTAPAGPARRADTPGAPAFPVETERTRIGRESAPSYIQRSPYERGSVTPRGDHPVYQPPARPYQRIDPQIDQRRAVPRASQPAPIVPSREPVGQPAPDAGPRGYARPRPSTGPQGAPSNAEGRGAFAPRPVPPAGGVGERQAPAPRAMPAPDRSAPSRGVAVPRSPGGAAPPPAPGAPSGARSRGRGGV
jgi:hypothetical protein